MSLSVFEEICDPSGEDGFRQTSVGEIAAHGGEARRRPETNDRIQVAIEWANLGGD